MAVHEREHDGEPDERRGQAQPQSHRAGCTRCARLQACVSESAHEGEPEPDQGSVGPREGAKEGGSTTHRARRPVLVACPC